MAKSKVLIRNLTAAKIESSWGFAVANDSAVLPFQVPVCVPIRPIRCLHPPDALTTVYKEEGNLSSGCYLISLGKLDIIVTEVSETI